MDKKHSYKRMLATGEIPEEIRIQMRRISAMLEAWGVNHESRFNSVKDASEGYLKSRGKLIPPEIVDWYEYCAELDRDPMQEIQDKDFLDYHQWRVKILNAPPPKQEKSYTVRSGGLCLVLAYKAGEIPIEIWNSDALKEYAENVFGIQNGHKTRRAAKEWENFMQKAEVEFPVDFALSRVLFKKHF